MENSFNLEPPREPTGIVYLGIAVVIERHPLFAYPPDRAAVRPLDLGSIFRTLRTREFVFPKELRGEMNRFDTNRRKKTKMHAVGTEAGSRGLVMRKDNGKLREGRPSLSNRTDTLTGL